MLRCALYSALYVVFLAAPCLGADELDFLDVAQSASSTFRFSDEEPAFEMASPSNTFVLSDDDAGGSCSQSPSCTKQSLCERRFLGVIAQSEKCFADFISPVTNPVYFENPRTVTEARMLFLHHRVPLTALDGNVNVLGLQIRAALSDRLSIIAAKSGFITSSNPVIEDGWADINLGVKYNLLANVRAQRLLSIGATYELPTGSTHSLQGNGGGLFDLFVTGGFAVGRWHAMSASGLLLPADRTEESSLWFWSNHLSREIGYSDVHLLGELNWYHWLGAGQTAFPLPIEGNELFNFGSMGVAGNDIATGAIGLRYKPSDCLELGMAWEAPLTDRRDIMDNRLTADCILRY